MNRYGKAIPLVALMLFSSIGTLWAQAQQPGTPNVTSLESDVLKTVVFIKNDVKFPASSGKPAIRGTDSGTGFIVLVPDSRMGKGYTFSYLVTNRHVAMAFDDQCVPLQIQRTYVTLNLRNPIDGSRLDEERIPPNARWYFPTDPAVDLAVMPFPLDSKKYDIKGIPLGLFFTSGMLRQDQIVPGDRVLTAGYFYQYVGLREMQPIVREGVLAMLPDGPMTTTTWKPGNLYLADIHIIKENSGSPIFVMMQRPIPGPTFIGMQTVFGLLGVVSGYMGEDKNATLKASTAWNLSVHANSGISTVVPAQQLKDLIEGPELQHLRDDAVKGRTKP